METIKSIFSRNNLPGYRGRTLARDLASRLAIVLTFIIFLLGGAYYLVTVTQAERDLADQASRRADELADVLSIPVWNLDANSVAQIAQVYLQAENLVALRVVDDAGVAIYESSTEEKNLIIEQRPIRYNNQQVGQVEVSTSTQQITKLRSTIFISLFVIVAVVALTIVVATWLLLQRYLNQPLATLLHGIANFAQGDYSQRLKPLAQNELNLIGEQFNEMAAQIQARDQFLEQRVADRTRDLSIASNVSRQITRVIELDQLLPQLVKFTREGFGLYCVSIFLYQPEKNILALEATSGKIDRRADEIVETISLNARPSLVAQATRERTWVVINDVSQTENFLIDPTLPDTRSEAVFPMSIGEHLIGVLDLQSEEINRFGEADIQILNTLAEQIGIAVRNAQLYLVQVQAAQELRRADQMKTQFLSSMSHELRTPLNAIINFVEMVMMEMTGPVTDEQKELLGLALQSSQHLLQLINDVLDITKIQAGRLTLFVENDVDLYKELGTVVEMVLPMLKDKPVQLVQEIEAGLPIISGDKRRIRQVLLNLLSNAIKFTDQGSVTVRARREGAAVLFAVIDTGSGVPPEAQAAIFEPFVQTMDGVKREQGTGLGLPISLNLVQAHGGKMWLESTPGEGSAFYFSLPVAADL